MNFTPRELVARIPSSIVKELTKQSNWLLRSVLIHFGHIQVIDKVHHLFGPRRPERAACLLLLIELRMLLEPLIELLTEPQQVSVIQFV